jgi:hypothetical protein
MSFRLFIYYCAIAGGWAALVGWCLVQALSPGEVPGGRAIAGFLLGLPAAAGIGMVDAMWEFARRPWEIAKRALTAGIVGGLGGILAGGLYELTAPMLTGPQGGGRLLEGVVIVASCTLAGLICGWGIGAYDWLAARTRGQGAEGLAAKMVSCLKGGAAGGLAGGLVFIVLGKVLAFGLGQEKELWSPGAFGLAAIGVAVGGGIGLARVYYRQAWLGIENGPLAGREMILCRPQTVLGRADTCHLCLTDDSSVERVHARIQKEERRFLLSDAGDTSGTFVNDQPITEPTALSAGDLIRIGPVLLRYQEKSVTAVEPAKAPKPAAKGKPETRNPFEASDPEPEM